ncbi:MAG: bifunctional methylenetetrahydrofolate dehydrogenase/methenyltetrahydrofolate cyclohydrolase FolD [Alphaproteobacteria bacterium]|nr:bifunctional methylenetetrahydrofolate dehydrogenase/methenyltetrahydrofolate cyclohydrolase FolD [Alphaproteobacteria bacterium]
MARILDGARLARTLNQQRVKPQAAALPRPPGLAVVMVGDDPASHVYVNRKGVVAGRLGFAHRQITRPGSTTQAELLDIVDRLNADPAIDGVLIQSPLPRAIDATAVYDRVDPAKDVDGFHPVNVGLVAQGRDGFVPCTPLGVMRLLAHGEVPLAGREAVVIGRSNIVGRPMARLLEQANCTVTVCHSRTADLEAHVRRAEVLVVAVGRPRVIPGAWIREGAAVIDVGVNRLDDGSLCGDVDYDGATERAGWITPVPRGVGPMTIAMLMENTLRSAARRQGVNISLG